MGGGNFIPFSMGFFPMGNTSDVTCEANGECSTVLVAIVHRFRNVEGPRMVSSLTFLF